MIVSTLSRVKQKAGKRANAPGLKITHPIGKQERLYPMNTSNLNTQQERFVIRRGLAMIVGASILAASSYAVIVKGNLDFAHALLICAMTAGLFAGAVSVGAVLVQKRYTLACVLIGALVCGELFAVVTSGERIVAERAADQARVEILKAAHVYAETELVKSQASHNEAVREKMRQAALPGCKDRCVALLDSAEAAAKADLAFALQRYESNPDPKTSASPLADRLGVPAWSVDLTIAALLSIGANCLAACLIGFAAHGVSTVKIPENSGDRPIKIAITEEPTLPSDDELAELRRILFGLKRPITNGELAEIMGVTKGESSKRVSEAVKAGVVSRKRVGREVAIALH